ncbi:unnamed protein product [Zymoseptoria tritici ST99CH_3D1]|nr:unnamed protein product [Zymoseptoria tritici ST99CH_3D1]
MHANMCLHRRAIFTTCGHSTFSPQPLVECRHACIGPAVSWSTTCQIVAHPYKTLKLDSLCPPCQARRDALLLEIEEKQVVKFDEWQWKVSYGMPSNGGKDYWGKKAEEREQEEKRRMSEVSTSTRRKSKRFSWRKSKKVAKLTPGDKTPSILEE